MANTAPYEITVELSDDETFAWAVGWDYFTDDPFPFDQYAIEYAVRDSDGSPIFTLTQDNGGVTVDAANRVVMFANETYVPCKGRASHGCRVRNLSSGRKAQIFDGSIIVSEGNF